MISPSNIETFYKNTKYSNIASHVKIVNGDSLYRTIHQAKGSEFDNVLVIVKGKGGYKYNEERELGFLLNSDIDGNEDHRVNYVTFSRTGKNFSFVIPEISDETKNKLTGHFELISIASLHFS